MHLLCNFEFGDIMFLWWHSWTWLSSLFFKVLKNQILLSLVACFLECEWASQISCLFFSQELHTHIVGSVKVLFVQRGVVVFAFWWPSQEFQIFKNTVFLLQGEIYVGLHPGWGRTCSLNAYLCFYRDKSQSLFLIFHYWCFAYCKTFNCWRMLQ